MLVDAPQVALHEQNDERDWFAEFLDEIPEAHAQARAADPGYQNIPTGTAQDLFRQVPLPPVRNRVDVIPASPNGTVASISLVGQDGSVAGSSTIDNVVTSPSSTTGMLDSGFISPVVVPTTINLDDSVTITESSLNITDIDDSQATILNSTLNNSE